ncbi:serine hydroxymethyltransferase [Stylonychia lemnae]|uniref:Serine hydroxymethyltransferase n=1 Tax=Stylonychia lemnae TaxID=5949 RepID=A0A078AHL6_STYLE|nr:serine hydroxymethyltransferase [Stylonychia lemnae]|eukprot:CDW80992.1 serine hydroxymethyltransferase [Stylonychia lemnae]
MQSLRQFTNKYNNLLKASSRFNFASKITRQLPVKDLSLKEHDHELYKLIEAEKFRQYRGIELIASENFTYKFVLECLGSALTNKYSEGYPGARYYGGNEYIDKIEDLARNRALEAYRLNPAEWGVNVQPYSGSPANLAVYTALLQPGERLMGLDLTQGGHLTHGYYTESKKVSATSLFWESKQYKVNLQTGHIDYDALEAAAKEFKPKIIIAGFSAYPRDLDYKRFRQIADSVGAYLLADMAHISGLVAAQELNNPFEYAHVVSTTTHKSLRGPRSGMIFARREIMDKIDFAVFPMLQGGPHNHQVAALAAQLKQVNTPEFKEYCQQVKKNAKALADELMKRGNKIVTDGTDNHLLLLDVRPHSLTGSKLEKACDEVHITLNKNTIIGDKSAITPGGVRIGTPAVTTRGYLEQDMKQVGVFIDETIKISKKIQETSGKKLKEFQEGLEKSAEIKQLAQEVEKFASQFDIPGFDATKIDA